MMDSLFIDFFSWLNVHKAGHQLLLHERANYHTGYVKACEVIQAELMRLLEEHKDGTDRIGRDTDILDEEISACLDNSLP